MFDEEAQGNYRLELLHKNRSFLAGYCKLIVYNIIPMSSAVCVIKNYVKVSTMIFLAFVLLLIIVLFFHLFFSQNSSLMTLVI